MKLEHGEVPLGKGQSLRCAFRFAERPQWLVATHGLGEHSGRHRYLFDLFDDRFNVFLYDLRWHGLSRATTSRNGNFSELVSDLDRIVTHLQTHLQMRRYVLFGHSMGALITAAYVQRLARPELYPDALFLSAPPVGLPGAAGALMRRLPRPVLALLEALPWSTPMGNPEGVRHLSHRDDVVHEFLNDPLSVTRNESRLLFGLVHTARQVFSRPLDARCPVHVAVGGADRVISPLAVGRYFAHLRDSGRLLVVPGAYHELHNELDIYRRHYFAFLRAAMAADREHLDAASLRSGTLTKALTPGES